MLDFAAIFSGTEVRRAIRQNPAGSVGSRYGTRSRLLISVLRRYFPVMRAKISCSFASRILRVRPEYSILLASIDARRAADFADFPDIREFRAETG
jgi:hypothetical protein